MDEILKINAADFEKQPDGSWVTVKNSNISTKGGNIITLSPGMIFKKGFKQFGGLEVAETLETISQN